MCPSKVQVVPPTVSNPLKSGKTLTCVKSFQGLLWDNLSMKPVIQAAAPDAFASANSETATTTFAHKRMARELRTLEAMIKIHCRDQHHAGALLCKDCQALLDYATVRLERCRFGAEKPTCARCPVHCYQRTRREQVKAVMRYSGPRMVWQHPVLSLFHLLDRFRKVTQ